MPFWLNKMFVGLGLFTQETEEGKTLNKGHYIPFLI
jgi:hypothetical protein